MPKPRKLARAFVQFERRGHSCLSLRGNSPLIQTASSTLLTSHKLKVLYASFMRISRNGDTSLSDACRWSYHREIFDRARADGHHKQRARQKTNAEERCSYCSEDVGITVMMVCGRVQYRSCQRHRHAVGLTGTIRCTSQRRHYDHQWLCSPQSVDRDHYTRLPRGTSDKRPVTMSSPAAVTSSDSSSTHVVMCALRWDLATSALAR